MSDHDDLRHGLSAYSNGKCRCQDCRAAFAAYMRDRRQRYRDAPMPPWIVHGTHNAYNNYGCRCGDCCATGARYMQAWRARRKAAAS